MVTGLFLTRVNFNFILSLYFRYQYSFYLETDLFAGRPADYLYFILLSVALLNVHCGSHLSAPAPNICFPSARVQILNYFAQMAAMWQSLSMLIVYLWSQHNRQVIVNFMFGIRFPALYLPLVLGILEFLLAGDLFGPLLGILVGHTYYILSTVYAERDPRWRARLKAPQWLASLVPRYAPTGQNATGGFRGYTVQRPRGDPAGDAASAAASSSFRVFSGKGQKLGQ